MYAVVLHGAKSMTGGIAKGVPVSLTPIRVYAPFDSEKDALEKVTNHQLNLPPPFENLSMGEWVDDERGLFVKGLYVGEPHNVCLAVRVLPLTTT